jgi:hypothetical protein
MVCYSTPTKMSYSRATVRIDQEKILEYPLPKRTQLLEEPLPERGAFVVLGFVNYTYNSCLGAGLKIKDYHLN